MNLSALFFINAAALGVGLAMDAFSVSLANGLHEPDMKPLRMHSIASVFSAFQALMPMIGWICIHTIAAVFTSFQKLIPWIALILLCFIGIKMLVEGIRTGDRGDDSAGKSIGFTALMLQGIATSIDALSVGFTIASDPFFQAMLEAVIIGAVTYILCFAGLAIGRRFGTRLAKYASVIGGIILIVIGCEIFITNVLIH